MAGKVGDHLQRRLAQAPADEKLRVIVRYRTRTPPPVLRAAQARRIAAFHLVPFTVEEAPALGVQTLADDENVDGIWLDRPVHTWLDQSVPLIGAPKVWDAGFKGGGIVICIVDTGVDASHPDLAGRLSITKDFTGEGFQDNNGHGTHVAGIAAGSGAESKGKYRGVAPEATLIAAKVLKGDGSGLMSDVMSGVEWGVDNGARVINLSLGSDGSCDGTDALSQICDAAVDAGVVVCVAAGNAGPAASTVGSPGCAFKVITVGASDRSDRIASFSSRGPTADGRLKPDISFPGVAIASCRARGTSMGQVIDDFYTAASGTSMATPHCAGAAALLLNAEPQLTPQNVKDRLMNSAKDLGFQWNAQGRGRAQVYEAYLGNTTPPPSEPPPSEPPTGCGGLLQSLGRLNLFGRPPANTTPPRREP